jgi:predicted TIM-barrel fold metal-dependent hydrolase
VYLDTSSSNDWVKYQAEEMSLPSVFRKALAVAGHERLLFGTDSSFFPRGWHAQIFERQVKALAEIGCRPEQASAILGGNLKRLLNLNRTARD